jgi:hypothetical protein
MKNPLMMVAVLALLLVGGVAAENATQENLNQTTQTPTENEEQETEEETSQQEQKPITIMPNHPLYGLTVAWDRVKLALERNPEARAEKALEMAEKRLLELEAMILEGRERHAERAQKHYERAVDNAQRSIARMDGTNRPEQAEDGLENAARAHARVAQHQERVAEVHDRILLRQQDRMSEEQIAHLTSVFGNISEKNRGLERAADAKGLQAVTKARALLNLSEEEAAEMAERAANRTDLPEIMQQRRERLQHNNEQAKPATLPGRAPARG